MLVRLAKGLMLAQAPPRGEFGAQPIAVIGAVCQQDLTGADLSEHIGGAATVMGLALRQLQRNREAVGVNEGVDLRR